MSGCIARCRISAALSIEAFLNKYERLFGRSMTTIDIRIDGAQTLIDGELHLTSIGVTRSSGGTIAAVGSEAPARRHIDGSGLIVLPGIVDIHGDAFERQMMPRPGVDFPIDIALFDTDRQVVANGITTVFHGVTWSWEPGLRGADNARAILEGIERLRPTLAADTRYHLRHETFNLDAEPEVAAWLQNRRIGMLAFNDHLTSMFQTPSRTDKLGRWPSGPAFRRRSSKRWSSASTGATTKCPARSRGLPTSRAPTAFRCYRMTTSARRSAAGIRALGCRVSEFPMTAETAQDAAREGDDIVFGAPNVVRGGSHLGWTRAADMVERGLCTILASDYYYPAQLLAAFRLADEGIASLGEAWELVSEAPALAAGLEDRGRIAEGYRADLILVDGSDRRRPRVVGTIVAGRVVHLTDVGRLAN